MDLIDCGVETFYWQSVTSSTELTQDHPGRKGTDLSVEWYAIMKNEDGSHTFYWLKSSASDATNISPAEFRVLKNVDTDEFYFIDPDEEKQNYQKSAKASIYYRFEP